MRTSMLLLRLQYLESLLNYLDLRKRLLILFQIWSLTTIKLC